MLLIEQRQEKTDAVIKDIESPPSNPRLSDVILDSPCRSFGTLAALPSNVHAIESALLFASGIQPFVAIIGPSGWGKSHLLDAVAYRIGQDQCLPPEVVSAQDWIGCGMRTDLSQALLLDNVQDTAEKGRSRQLLQLALERRVKSGRPTLLSFTATRVSRHIRSLLPQPREWTIGFMAAPDPTERVIVVTQIASAEGVRLSSALTRLLAHKMKGNGRTLVGAIKRLKLYCSDWTDLRSTLRACGVLDPFFADNSSWDLRDRILRATEPLTLGTKPVLSQNIAAYIMLREAALSEASVARYLGIEPGEAYLRATLLAQAAQDDRGLRDLAADCIAKVVESLVSD